MAWSPQQEAAIRRVRAWLADPAAPQVFRLFGYAGTGKTTLARELSQDVRGRVLYGAFTGKAAMVLQRRGCAGASTIHSMIYRRVDQDQEEPDFAIDPESSVLGAGLIVVDEVSMVDAALGEDLLSFGVRVLVLGDPAQLPPVGGAGGYFTEAEPDVMLTEVHRQAADNPIITLATRVRGGERLRIGDYGESRVVSQHGIDRDALLAADQVLVGRNRTRQSYNNRIRELRGLPSGEVVEGDKLVCLRNDRDLKLLNGGLWTVAQVLQRNINTTRLTVRSDDFPERPAVKVMVRNEFFDGNDADLDWRLKRDTQEFTYGYALTVHKSQGSQWASTYLFDESAAFRQDWARWLYTGLTRAAERVTVVL